jgi:hypothetical protein
MSTQPEFQCLFVRWKVRSQPLYPNISLARAHNLLFDVWVASRTLSESPLQRGINKFLTCFGCLTQFRVEISKLVKLLKQEAKRLSYFGFGCSKASHHMGKSADLIVKGLLSQHGLVTRDGLIAHD